MDVSTIINLSRDQTGTPAWQISDTDYLNYLNIIYKDIFSRLSVNAKKYAWQSFVTEVNAWQSEYILPQPSEDSTWLKLVLTAFLDWKKLPLYDSSLYDSERDLTNPKIHEHPYWILRDGSIFAIQYIPIATISDSYGTLHQNVSPWCGLGVRLIFYSQRFTINWIKGDR